MTRVIGLISGTSVDGIDAALVEISGTDIDLKVELIAGETYPYPSDLREKILAICGGAAISMAEFAELDDAIGLSFAQAALAIQSNHTPAQLIGSHGQTVYHRPPSRSGGALERGSGEKSNYLKDSPLGYSLQLGRGELIAQVTGITTVNNFRVADIAAGGEGAPLVSRIDAFLLSHPNENRCVQNIGGIGNVTYLPARQGNWLSQLRGWDTGPGNALLDLAVQHLTGGSKTYDKDGAWAASGTPCIPLVRQWLQHEFFRQAPPKSTGRELFGADFLRTCLADAENYLLSSADLLATLTELTAASIADSYRSFLPQMPDKVLLCGGGSRNLYLKNRLQTHLSGDAEQSSVSSISVLTTDEVGLNADCKEAIAFAVLAYWRNLGIPGNLKQVTGAQKDVLLGEIKSVTAP
ncbi:anhydro-N-acetylmuramic acid kinase [Planktothrix sp. FACHB-1355]|uniref:anhydro-N-acetylmuramic acid kinase n=1 Tax=Planktothrix sp. FACHB-1355 TaxID=2692854 RepID=UPI00168BB60C|nr:anhydro-N-acetylmuramic acid kinase [Planktothrix sp. FACHB-1355]MBD3562128.1 anhydro-N-acetylmuramic acid kinase [Planktothrix sp. FACHB-1355]